jgi:hypothetical protein
MNHGSFGSDFIGSCKINMRSLYDQNKHDCWFELRNRDGSAGKGRIRLIIQWIYSKVLFYSENLLKYDDTL